MRQLKFKIEDIFNLTGAEIFEPDKFVSASEISTDTRKLKKGAIFLALRGGRFDGHKFVSEAADKGASSVIIEKKYLKNFDSLDICIITVPDTTKAYGELANIRRNKMSAKVISLSGSSGKTTLKEMTAAILSEKFKVAKTEANNNNQIGVPLTILSAKPDSEILIIEHGTNHFGEIKYTADIARPDMAILTNIGNSHTEFLKNPKGVLAEKKALLDAAEKNKGKVLINLDDKLLAPLAGKYRNAVTFGFSEKADAAGHIIGFDDFGRAEMRINYKNKNLRIINPLPGKANAANLLAATAIALTSGVGSKRIADGIKKISPVSGRLNVKMFDEFMLVDDAYNSNPESLRNAVDFVKKLDKYKRKIFILGDMFELGAESRELHEKASSFLPKNKNAEIYLLGKNMKFLAEKLTRAKCVSKHFSRRNSLRAFLKKLNIENSVILIKGSNGMKMNEFVNLLEERTN